MIVNIQIEPIGSFLSVSEFSKFVGQTPQAIRKALDEKRITKALWIGNQRVIHEDEIDNYITVKRFVNSRRSRRG